MSRTRRNFSAKFKSELVIELLKGEKDLNTLAAENNIQPNLLRNWKKEFLDKASVVFDDTREDNLKEKLSMERKEKAAYARKVGQLTMQVDWLKKNLKKHLDLTTRVNLVRNLLKTKELPVKTGATLLGVNRTKSRWADNIMIERWFRSFKYEEAYLTQYANIREARKAIGKYIHTYSGLCCGYSVEF